MVTDPDTDAARLGFISPLVIGHRGAAGHAPENTLAAFEEAAKLGIKTVEFDVRLTRDGVPVVLHDRKVNRTTDGRGKIDRKDLSETRKLDAGSWYGSAFAGQRIPTLKETLETCLKLGLTPDIEIKAEKGREVEVAEATMAVATAVWPKDRDPPLVTSFSEEALQVAKERAPDWPRGILYFRRPSDWRDQVDRVGAVAVGVYGPLVGKSKVKELAGSGCAVFIYGTDDPSRAKKLVAAGASTIITDTPRAIGDALIADLKLGLGPTPSAKSRQPRSAHKVGSHA